VTTVTVTYVDDNADAPPPGTAIVRPLRHVQAVRGRHRLRFASPSEVAASHGARAWAWALGETATAPVTGQQTAVPPGRADIEAEIKAADERRLRGDHENRADAAATILRWLIGDDDHVPIRCDNPGDLVGGFGAIIRPRDQIAALLAEVTQNQHCAAALSSDPDASPDQRQRAGQDADYSSGVAATLSWVLGQSESPITRRQAEPTSSNLKTERLHAEDLAQAAASWLADRALSPQYGEAVQSTLTWLLGDSRRPD
jgi:hypothetical protein